MKMIFRQKNNKKYVRLIGIIVGFLVLITIISWLAPKAMPFVAQNLAVPVWEAGDHVASGVSGLFRFLEPKKEILAENDYLRKRVNELSKKEFLYSQIAHENETLRQITTEKNNSRIIARVLSKPPVTPFDILTIDLGTSEGVFDDALVFSEEGYNIGRIVGALPSSSTVQMFSSSGEEIPAFIDRNGIEVILVGEGGGNFSVEISKDVDIKNGDLIVIRADDELVPVAVIVSADVKDGDPLARFTAHTPVNIFELTHVAIQS